MFIFDQRVALHRLINLTRYIELHHSYQVNFPVKFESNFQQILILFIDFAF